MASFDPMYGPAKSAINYLVIFVGLIVVYIVYKILKKK